MVSCYSLWFREHFRCISFLFPVHSSKWTHQNEVYKSAIFFEFQFRKQLSSFHILANHSMKLEGEEKEEEKKTEEEEEEEEKKENGRGRRGGRKKRRREKRR